MTRVGVFGEVNWVANVREKEKFKAPKFKAPKFKGKENSKQRKFKGTQPKGRTL